MMAIYFLFRYVGKFWIPLLMSIFLLTVLGYVFPKWKNTLTMGPQRGFNFSDGRIFPWINHSYKNKVHDNLRGNKKPLR